MSLYSWVYEFLPAPETWFPLPMVYGSNYAEPPLDLLCLDFNFWALGFQLFHAYLADILISQWPTS